MIHYVGIDIFIVENNSFENNKKVFQNFLDSLKTYDKTCVQIAF